jgi:hypothetical protein
MAKRLHIKVSKHPVIRVARSGVHEQKLVYVACANRLQLYPHGRSRVVYIGTTKKGIARIAASAARAATRFLTLHGVREISLSVVTCPPRPGMKSWLKLERGLLLAFKEVFGSVPIGNTQGKNSFWSDEYMYFKPARLRAVVRSWSTPPVRRSKERKSRRTK